MMNSHNTTKDVPNTIGTEKVFQWWDYLFFILLTGLNFAAFLYFFSYWFSLKQWMNYPGTFSVMTFILIIILSFYEFPWFLLPYMTRPKPILARSGWKVGVATTFVPGAEPLEMLEETVKALVAMAYPHDTWVLDEGDDDQVKRLCHKLGVNHFSRKHLSHYHTDTGTFQTRTKHGNYNAWLAEIGFGRYDIITAFDPDHIPDSHFLSKVLGYFEDPKVAYVQAAQAYYNQKASFIARGSAEETYAYYSSVQMACYRMGYPIVTGCHNTHRVTALKQVGGFAPHDADDLLITLLYRSSGWQGVYVPAILARGLTPVDWRGYLTQQRRWAASVLDIKFRIHPRLSKDLPLKTRVISFLHGLNYVQESLNMFAALSLLSFMLASGTIPVLAYLFTPKLAILYAVLLLCDFYRQRFYLDWRNEWGLPWRAILLRLAKGPYVLLALYDVVTNRRVPYRVTLKVRSKSRRYMLLRPHMLIISLICTAWIIGIVYSNTIHPSLHIWASIMVMGETVLIMTEFMNFPDPYEKTNSQPRA